MHLFHNSFMWLIFEGWFSASSDVSEDFLNFHEFTPSLTSLFDGKFRVSAQTSALRWLSFVQRKVLVIFGSVYLVRGADLWGQNQQSLHKLHIV